MIIKSYEIKKIENGNFKYYLFYGENRGFKDEIINTFTKKEEINKLIYFENEILENTNNFYNSISSKSFFENEKIIIIKKSTDKIKNLIEEIIAKNYDSLTIILDAEVLEKKSKLRNYFEKEKELICIPFYSDNYQTLNIIAQNFFNKRKIKISTQTLNLIIERANGKRKDLNTELNKIENYLGNKQKIDLDEAIKLTNFSGDYDISELVDNCLAQNKTKLIKIINENNFSNDDSVLIIRSLLSKSKRLLRIQEELEKNINLETIITTFKPPIFWKDKEVVKKQVKLWSKKNAFNLIFEINQVELLIKKNFQLSKKILMNFILEKTNSINSGA